MKYRKKPVVIEAYQTDKEMDIETLEGTMHASVGDYIITGVRGEQYPCKPDIFEQTYEPADVPTASPWHRVEEELPSMDGYDWVLGIVTGEAGYLRFHKAVMMVSFDPQYKEWFIDEYTDAKITVSHWMELPEPPKEDKR